MAHNGEDIKFTIKGDSKINLIDFNFKVLVYQQNDCCIPENVVVITKKDNFEPVFDRNGNQTNSYIGKIPYTITKNMKEGKYNMELLLIKEILDDIEERSIFLKKNAFNIECSASKNIE